jgi:hypothetical protein
MDDAQKPARDAASLHTLDGVRGIWNHFRAGGSVPCPADGVPMALAVDAFAAAYRFVCPTCGMASSWFESGVNGVRVMDEATSPFGTRLTRP